MGPVERRKPLRLLAEIAPHRRPGGADRLAQGFGDDVSVSDLDREGIDVDDEIARRIFEGARGRGLGRLGVGQHRSAVEVLAPARLGGLKDDDAVRKAVGGDHIGHRSLGRRDSAGSHSV